MKLTRLDAEAFRVFQQEVSLDFAGDVVILIGPNGAGKTSVFDAIEWGLFGLLPRLRGSRDAVGDDYVRNRFTPDASPEVTLYLEGERGTSVLRRSALSLLVVDDERSELSGEPAARWVARQVAPSTDDGIPSAVDAFERMYLLGQERIVDFVRDTNPRDRFDSLSTLLGADIVRRFYRRVETWIKSAEQEGRDARLAALQAKRVVEELRLRRSAVEARDAIGPDVTVDRIAAELHQLQRLGTSLGLNWPPDEALRDADTMTQALRDLATQLSTLHTRLSNAVREALDLQDRSRDVSLLREQLSHAAARRASRIEDRAKLQDEAEAARRTAAEAESKLRLLDSDLRKAKRETRELVQLLTLARAHVTEASCPVCQQSIDATALRARLTERIQETAPREAALLTSLANAQQEATAARDGVDAALSQLQSLDRADAVDSEMQRSYRRDISAWESAAARLVREWNAPDLDAVSRTADEQRPVVQRLAERLVELQGELAAIRARSELAGVLEAERTAGVEQLDADATVSAIDATVHALRKVSADAKNAEIDIVRESIEQHLPSLQALYRRLNPHPLFDTLDIRFDSFKDRGEVYYRAVSGTTAGNVSMLFSSAQLNAVAVSVFMALNLMRPGPGLEWLLLDDPIQNMDDYNVLGLVDLLRSVRGERQLIVSTHDEQLGALFLRKLRPAQEGHRTIAHRFIPGDERGPHILTSVDEFQQQQRVLPIAG